MSTSFRFPNYPKKAHASGHARIRVHGKDCYLGKHNSAESRQRYAELALQFATNQEAMPPTTTKVTISEVVVRWESAAVAARGPKSREVRDVISACTPMLRGFGRELAEEFSAKKLDTVRELMLSGVWMTDDERALLLKQKKPIGWSRSYCNHQICRVRSMWRWAEVQGLAPKGMWDHLRSLPPIPPYRTVRQTIPRKAVDDAHVDAAMVHMTLQLTSMVRVQLATGLRPGELVRMLASEVKELSDGSGLGEYRFAQHKNFWRDGQETVAILPEEAMEILRPWLELARRAGPDAPVWKGLRGTVAKSITTESYVKAIGRACDLAGVPHFVSYQLRHATKRRVTRTHGLDAARAVLRQKSIATTDRYSSQIDIETAKKVAADAGKEHDKRTPNRRQIDER